MKSFYDAIKNCIPGKAAQPMRMAVYFVPHSCPSLMKAAAQWLGGKEVNIASIPATELDTLLQAPNHYGFHATIKPPFRLNNGYALHDVENELAAFVKEVQPFVLPPLELARINNFFCLRLKSKSGALQSLAAETVQRLDHFRRPAEEQELARRRAAGLSERQEQLLLQWGYPYVLDEFRFHLTLTGNMDNERQAKPIRRELSLRFTPVIQESIYFDELCLFVQHGNSAFTEYKRFPFGGKGGRVWNPPLRGQM